MKLRDGILSESVSDHGQLVFWVKGERAGGCQEWERIASVGPAQLLDEGMWGAAATVTGARQRLDGFVSGFIHRFRKTAGDWSLPDGTTARQAGSRRSNVVLVWGDEDGSLDEERVRSWWPGCTAVRRLGETIWLVEGAALADARVERVGPPAGCPRAEGERLLAEARAAGNLAGEAAALTDLGVMSLRENDTAGAAARFEQALVLARRLGDREREHDILGNLGMAVLALGQIQAAQELFNKELAFGRERQDPFIQKLALERLGLVEAKTGGEQRGLTLLQEGLALARSVGDRQHEADLLWEIAIQEADQGRHRRAVQNARAAIDVLEALDNPEAKVLATHLQRYVAGECGSIGAGHGAVAFGWHTGAVSTGPAGAQLLRMGFSAAKSLATFFKSGCRTVSSAVRRRRLGACAVCPHHTGLRCKVCGCFTDLKARLAHERCPIGRWQGSAS
jgi:tetratricopeptide (TPR) repeat protein